ncbi:chondroitinase-B domain-containing protein [Parvularcula marina]|uniref:chondroitinase-B domain-containing protein n=1 Tax=Parvularcula marina TaxID=2292771 RepID=UPI0035131EE2
MTTTPRHYRHHCLKLAAVLMCTATAFGGAMAKDFLVSDQKAYGKALKRVKAGDRILLADGEWKDFEITFEATGTEDKPVTLMAETPGEVYLTGQSNLRIGGDHLVISGLTFTDGYSPSDEVISFRTGDDTLASHVRFTENVIEGFSKPDRTEQDSWVVLYGQNNWIDHNAFLGKTNKGPTMIVRLTTPDSQNNSHLIEQNFFGERPPLGGNGGETLRIGVSQTSRTNSGTIVRQNYFERCDGEVEIISIKSEGNLVTENVFYESRGSVVFRHGGRNEVSRNVFFGNGVPDTGGIRIINDNQTVRDNYLEGLRGRKFLGALVIMNGVPNSPENRYHQVENALIENNSFIDFVQMGFGVGSDEERSAAPVSSRMSGNLLLSDEDTPVGIFDDVSGISFDGNVTSSDSFEAINAETTPDLTLERAENGLLYPAGSSIDSTLGAPRDLSPIARSETGPRHFQKAAQQRPAGDVIDVEANAAAFRKAVMDAEPGDTLKLDAGEFELAEPLVISSDITIEGTAGMQGTSILSTKTGMFTLDAGANLILKDLSLTQQSGSAALFHARGEIYRGDYRLELNDVSLTADTPAAGAVLSADPATFAREVILDDVAVIGWPGSIISLSGNGFDGWYLSDEIIITNSHFSDVSGALIEFGREGRDESTFGPRFTLTDSQLENVGAGDVAIDLEGIDGLRLQDNQLTDTGTVNIRRRVLGLPFEMSGNAVASSTSLTLFGVNGEAIDASLSEGIQ